MLKDRIEMYKQLEEKRGSKLLVYVTGDRAGAETRVAKDAISFIIKHLDALEETEKISLFLYTQGGDALAAWKIVNLIKQFCHEFEVIVPFRAHSAGTLICLGANNIVMTKQATLSPIDPSLTTPFNPMVQNPAGGPPIIPPISVEAIKGYLELASEDLKIMDSNNMTQILINLSNKIHPIVLGQTYRAKAQIKMLAEKLLKNQIEDTTKIQDIINFLCTDSGSHDYTINRQEGESFGLKIEKPDNELYSIINNIYSDISNELELETAFNPQIYINKNITTYTLRRGLVESINYGCNVFLTEGVFSSFTQGPSNGNMKIGMQDKKTFEGWRHENV